MLKHNYGSSPEKVTHCTYLQILQLCRPDVDQVAHQPPVICLDALQTSFSHQKLKKDWRNQVWVSMEQGGKSWALPVKA